MPPDVSNTAPRTGVAQFSCALWAAGIGDLGAAVLWATRLPYIAGPVATTAAVWWAAGGGAVPPGLIDRLDSPRVAAS